MRKHELRTPVVPDRDIYAEAHAELSRIQFARKQNWAGLDYDDRTAAEVTWQEIDPHLAAAKEQLHQPRHLLDEATRDDWREREIREYEKWEKERKQARLLVEVAERTGAPVDPEIRRLAEEPDRRAALDEFTAKLDRNRKRTYVTVMST